MVDDPLDFEATGQVVADDGFTHAVMARVRGVQRRRSVVFACATAAGVMLALPGLVEVTAWMGNVGPAIPTAARDLMTFAAATPLTLYATLAAAWLLGSVID